MQRGLAAVGVASLFLLGFGIGDSGSILNLVSQMTVQDKDSKTRFGLKHKFYQSCRVM